MLIIFTQGWEPLKCINKYFVFIYMQLQIWDFFYEIGRISTGETTYLKIFIISLLSLYMSQLLNYCVLASNLPFCTLLGDAGAQTVQIIFSH